MGLPHCFVALACAPTQSVDDSESVPLTANSDSVAVTVPAGVEPGATIQVMVNGNPVTVQVPDGVSTGQQFFVTVAAATVVAKPTTVLATAAPAPQDMSIDRV